MSLHPFRALVLQPGLTPEQIVTLRQVADLMVSDAGPALRDAKGCEADILMDQVQIIVAPDPGARGMHKFCAAPAETHARLLQIAAVAVVLADRIAGSFKLVPSLPLSTEARLDGAQRVVTLAHDVLALPCDVEPAQCDGVGGAAVALRETGEPAA